MRCAFRTVTVYGFEKPEIMPKPVFAWNPCFRKASELMTKHWAANLTYRDGKTPWRDSKENLAWIICLQSMQPLRSHASYITTWKNPLSYYTEWIFYSSELF
jgi:hypothetical protein